VDFVVVEALGVAALVEDSVVEVLGVEVLVVEWGEVDQVEALSEGLEQIV
jgi:hypothetical protein